MIEFQIEYLDGPVKGQLVTNSRTSAKEFIHRKNLQRYAVVAYNGGSRYTARSYTILEECDFQASMRFWR